MTRILVVEDEVFVGIKLVIDLTDAGYEAVGPAASVAAGRDAIAEGAFDFVFLDVNLAGTLSKPLAVMLKNLGTPFVYLTGYDEEFIERNGMPEAPVVQKPYTWEDIRRLPALPPPAGS